MVVILLVALVATSATAQTARLYTRPDPQARGGITGRIVYPPQPLLRVLAVPPSQPEHVFDGEILGEDRQSFRFAGLPVNRYDLVVIYPDRIFEGVQLMRTESTLTDDDRAQIQAILDRSEPFYSIKLIHRLEGQTGRGGTARAVCIFGREQLRRTYKLVLLRQVGPGWQVERTREWLPIELAEGAEVEAAHAFVPALSGIRVTDQIRDLGELNLQSAPDAGRR